MAYETRQYVIFNVSELHKIDFSQVLETSAETVRKSVDGTKTFVKWEGEAPSCVLSLTTKGSYLTHEEIITILATEEWTVLMEMIGGS
jgi:hypothetical protein